MSISFTLASQPYKNGDREILCIRCQPWMCFDCFSGARKPLSIKFIKIITAYGTLIISIIPVACHGRSVGSFVQTILSIFSETKPHFIPCPQVAFQLERQRRIKLWF